MRLVNAFQRTNEPCQHILSCTGENMSTALILLSDFQKTEIELWRPVEGLLGYDISSLGRVRSFWRKSGSGKMGGLHASGRRRGSWTYVLGTKPVIRTAVADKDGYQFMVFSVKGKSIGRRVHRLVAAAFIANDCPDLAVKVNHKTNIKNDNRLPNLEWCTEKENRDHARAIGAWPVGERVGTGKLTAKMIVTIRRLVANGATYTQTAADYGVSRQNISNIVKRKIWQHV